MALDLLDRPVNSKYLDSCEIPFEEKKAGSFIMVIFGGAGDLSKRKLLPTLYHLFKDKRLIDDFYIIGFGKPDLSDNEYRKIVDDAVKEFLNNDYDKKVIDEFLSHVLYLSADLVAPEDYKLLCRKINEVKNIFKDKDFNLIYYMAVQPGIVLNIINILEELKLCKDILKSKIILEKPFGVDKESAIKLNENILKAFDEKQIYRIDHYLGKDTVLNILFFRFANSIFEPMWNRRYIDHIQITVSEDIGIEHRGKFYEQAGVVRDIVQNHIMQLIALVACEPPVGFEADLIRDEIVKVLRTIRIMDTEYLKNNVVMGQYGRGTVNGKEVCGYREENDVSQKSIVPTYFAAKIFIDNWRWAQVPFYIRTGKRLAKRVTEIYVQFKQPPLKLFGRLCDPMEPNALIITVQPDENILLRMSVKYPGIYNHPYTVNMDFNYEKSFGIKSIPAYTRLIMDCIKGDLTLFARQDAIEAMWSFIDPINKWWENLPHKISDSPNYDAGTWGPSEASLLMSDDGRKWRFEE